MTSIALITALLAAVASSPAAPVQTDFTGTWVLDAARSVGLPPDLAVTMTMKQAGDRIDVETHLKSPMGEQETVDAFELNGVEADFKPSLNAPYPVSGRRMARWSEDRNGFESTDRITVDAPDGAVNFTSVLRWSLPPGSDTLTVEVTMNGPQGERKSTRVFVRQSPAD